MPKASAFWKLLLLLLAVSCGIGLSRPARAATPPPVRLDYNAPPDCPRVDEFRGRVSNLVAVNWVTSAEVNALRLNVTLAVDERGARGTLTLITGQEAPLVRQLNAANCTELADAMLMVVALILDPENQRNRPPKRAAPPPAPPREPIQRTEVWLEPGLFLIGGPGPDTLWGGSVSVGLRLESESALRLAARVSLRQSESEDRVTDVGTARFAWRALGLELCPLVFGRQLRLELCGAMDLGQTLAQALVSDREIARTWLAPGLGGHLALAVSKSVALEGAGALLFPLTRDRFLLTPVPIYQPPAVSWRAGLALTVRFL